jgi:hypothetical protein
VRLVQLQAAHSKVRQQSVQARRLNHSCRFRKRPRLEDHLGHLAAKLGPDLIHPGLRQLHRLRVAVEADQPALCAQPLRDLSGMPAQPDRRIRNHAAGPHIEVLENFV